MDGKGVAEMSFSPRFAYSDSMVKDLGIIEAARAVIEVLPLPPDQALLLRQSARQRATRNSTAIEGNKLNSIEVGKAVVANGRSSGDMQQEVRNYWRALEWIEEQLEARRPLSEALIKELHAVISVRAHGRRGQQSAYRTSECPVVDAATRLIDYAPPKPQDVAPLMAGLVEWWASERASALPGPVRAALAAHRFVSIHPFGDGNGRTARALATLELWRSGYEMRGFLSLEEHYTADLQAYYASLQMGLPVDFYEGRHDPDHSQWLAFFLATMAKAAEVLRQRAIALHDPGAHPLPPWEGLRRTQQQLLTRLLTRCLSQQTDGLTFTPTEVMGWYGVSANTAREWLDKWRQEEFVQPLNVDAQRVRVYKLSEQWATIVRSGFSARRKTS